MVKAYLRYVEDACWGVIVSTGGHVIAAPGGKSLIVPALEAVKVWSIRQGRVERTIKPAVGVQSEVTALEISHEGNTLAVGHADGAVRLWQPSDGTERVTLTGHRGAVTTLRFSQSSTMLISAGSDTNVVVWDVVGELGICKLRGHRGPVTDVCFLEGPNAIASVSKDGMLKLWDVDMQHCVQTVGAPSGELWTVDILEAAGRLLTGGAGGEILVWSIEQRLLADNKPNGVATAVLSTSNGAAEGDPAAVPPQWLAPHASMLGTLASVSNAHVVRVRFGASNTCVAVQFADRKMQVFSVQAAVQLKRQLKRRVEKKKKKQRQSAAAGNEEGDEEEVVLASSAEAGDEGMISATDMFQPLSQLRGTHKLHSFCFMPAAERHSAKGELVRPSAVSLIVAQRNNCVGVWECPLKPHSAAVQLSSVSSGGHRQEPRCAVLSSDERQLLTVADGEAKVWSVSSQQCMRTIACGYGLCVTFVLGGRFVLVGTKAGTLQLFSMASGELVEEVAAHGGAVWSLALEPGGRAILSASADKTIATWMPHERGSSASLKQDRSHQLDDDVMCARYSSDAKFVAVALLDAAIKIFFHDTFKLFLSLYGHKLPVLSLSLSSDGNLIISGSADKSVKIWGLDFGDCHRSLLAHTDSVMCVQFVRNTHYFFSAGKDKLIKYWDADTFEPIMTLRAHHAEVWSLAISRNGELLASVSRDRSLRLWRRSEEQVFVNEEKEAEMEALFEEGVEKQQQTEEAAEEEATALGLEGGAASASAMAGRRTIESVKGAERVLEALKVLDEEEERRAEHALALTRWQASSSKGDRASKQPVLVPNMLLLGLDPAAYLLKALSSVRAAELDQALMLLPFDTVRRLLSRLLPLLDTAPPIELIARTALFLLRVHHKQIVANQALLQLLHGLDHKLRARLTRERDVLGFNMAALSFAKQFIEAKSDRSFFEAHVSERSSHERSSVTELRRRTAARESSRKPKKHTKKLQ